MSLKNPATTIQSISEPSFALPRTREPNKMHRSGRTSRTSTGSAVCLNFSIQTSLRGILCSIQFEPLFKALKDGLCLLDLFPSDRFGILIEGNVIGNIRIPGKSVIRRQIENHVYNIIRQLQDTRKFIYIMSFR